jgi:uncharacterized protein (TIGR02145 family)
MRYNFAEIRLMLPAAVVFMLFLTAGCGQKQKVLWQEGPPLVDHRDGQTYKTVYIGGQLWMAENLNYGKAVPDCRQTDNDITEKTWYKNDPELGALYGGLYTWDEAMNWGGEKCISPEGWRIPSLEDWQALIEYIGVDSAGHFLKAAPDDEISWDGVNRYGFRVIPAGTAYENHFGRQGQWAVFWTSTEYDSAYAWFAQLDGFWYPQPPKYKNVYLGNYYLKQNAFSIRCIKDADYDD